MIREFYVQEPLDRLLRDRAHNEKRTLDLGAGTGRISDYLTVAGRSVVAYDIHGESLRETVARHPSVLGGGENLAFKSECFDMVVCLWVLEHVDRPERVLSEIHRVLAPGGRLFLAVPCRKGLPSIFGSLYAKVVHSFAPGHHTHLGIEHNFSYRDFRAMLSRACFQVEEVRHGGFAVTNFLVKLNVRFRPAHALLSKLVEKMHLSALTINTVYICVPVAKL